MDDHSIPSLDKPRLSKMPGYKLVPQLRGEYYGFAVDRKPFDNPKLRQAFAMAIDREVFPKFFRAAKRRQLHGFRRACWRIIPRSAWPSIPMKRSRLLRKPVIRTVKACRRSSWATTPWRITSSWPKRFKAMWQKNLNVVVKIENQEWKVYLKKLQTDPFVVHRAGWGADYPDPDNFMKLFTSNSGNNHGRWKNPKYRPIARPSRPASRTRKANPTVRRSAKNSYRNRRRHRAAVLESRSDAVESQVYRLGIQFDGADGFAKRQTGGQMSESMRSLTTF